MTDGFPVKCVDFFLQLDVTMELAGVYVKRLDKKRERQILFNHKHLLCEQLAKESMPAMCLHLACIILFQRHSQCMLHAPGRCVPQIIEWLASVVEPDVQALLKRIQHHVIQETIVGCLISTACTHCCGCL